MNKKVIEKIGLVAAGVAIGALGAYLLGKETHYQTFVDVREDMTDIVKQITVFTKTGTDVFDVGGIINEQLRGNQDYIDCNIVLNDEPVIDKGVQIGTYITYTVYKESVTNPIIKLEA